MEDIIITALAIAAALIFKVIEKKLKSAARKSPIVGTYDTFTNASPEHTATVNMDTFDESVEIPEPVRIPEPVEEAPRAVAPVEKKVVLQEKPAKPKDKIDPKKLVIYSEIMKPKYLE